MGLATLVALRWINTQARSRLMSKTNVIAMKPTSDSAIVTVAASYEELGLKLNKERQPISCLENVVKILEDDADFNDVIAFNDFTVCFEKRRPTPWGGAGYWVDGDDMELRLWLSQKYDLRALEKDVIAGVWIIGKRASYHPVRQYVEATKWDGKPRLCNWLMHYMGASVPNDDQDLRSEEYYAKAGTWWLISAIARIYDPGCQADHVLLLEGTQGGGKSSTLKMLFGEWFSDTPVRIGNKDSYGALHGVWGYELAELDAFNRAESSASKAFFSARQDKYRPPFGRRDMIVQRQNVFAGTTNHDQYLRDATGNRRYWPVRCGKIRVRGPDSVESDRDQIWAEALALYQEGVRWYPVDADEVAMFGEHQAEREIGDVYEALINEKTRGLTEISMVEIFTDVLDIEPAKMTRAEQIRVGECMKRLGWEKKRTGRADGRQYVYERLLVDSVGITHRSDAAGSIPI